MKLVEGALGRSWEFQSQSIKGEPRFRGSCLGFCLGFNSGEARPHPSLSAKELFFLIRQPMICTTLQRVGPLVHAQIKAFLS